MCRFIWEWIYARPIEPQDTRGHFEGVLGGHKSKSLGRLSYDWTDWHQIWYTSAYSSGNEHRLITIRPSTLGGGGGGGVRGSHIQKSDEHVKGLVRLASNLVHMCRFIWERIYAKQIALRDTRVHLGGGGGFRGSNIQVRGSCQTPGPIGTNFGSRLRIHLGMGI